MEVIIQGIPKATAPQALVKNAYYLRFLVSLSIFNAGLLKYCELLTSFWCSCF